MTARYGAFEPWWHVYEDADRERAGALGRQHRPGRPRRPAVRDALGRGAPADLDRSRAHARPGPAPPRRADGQPRPRGARAAAARPRTTRGRATGRGRSCSSRTTSRRSRVGFGHALVLRAGRAVAAGPIAEVLRDEILSRHSDCRWRSRRTRAAGACACGTTRVRHQPAPPWGPYERHPATPDRPGRHPRTGRRRPGGRGARHRQVPAGLATGARRDRGRRRGPWRLGADRRPPAGRDLPRRGDRSVDRSTTSRRARRTSWSACSGRTTSSPSRS